MEFEADEETEIFLSYFQQEQIVLVFHCSYELK